MATSSRSRPSWLGSRIVPSGDHRSSLLAARREGAPDEDHVGAELERGEIARRGQAPRGVTVPVDIHRVRGLLRGGEGAFREIVERLLRERGDWSAMVKEFESGKPEDKSI